MPRRLIFVRSKFANLLLKRSTRPVESRIFCVPVKNGWQAEQISVLIGPGIVERVSKLLPHAQLTVTVW